MDEQATTQPSSPFARIAVRALFAVAILCVAAAALAWTQRIWIATKLVPVVLEDKGIGPLKFTIRELRLGHAIVTDIRMGGPEGQHIESVEARYKLSKLFGGKVDRVVAKGLKINGEINAKGLTFNGISVEPDETSTEPPTLPVRYLSLEDLALTVKRTGDTITLNGDAVVETPEDGLRDVNARFTVRADSLSDKASLEGRLMATHLSTGEAYGRVTLNEAQVASSTVSLNKGRGEVQFILHREDALDIDARLTIPEMTVAGETLRDNRISLGLRRAAENKTGFDIDANLRNRSGHIDLTGKISETTAGDRKAAMTLAADIAKGSLKLAAAGRATGRLTSAGRISGAIEISDAAVAFAGIDAGGIRGQSTFVKDAGSLPEGVFKATVERFRGFGISGNPSSLSVTVGEDSVDAAGKIDWDGGNLALTAQGPLSGPLAYRAAGRLDGAGSAALLPDEYSAQGHATFDLTGTIRDPLETVTTPEPDFDALFENVRLNGWIDSALTEVSIPDVLQNGTVTGRLEITSNENGLRLATKSLRAAVAQLAKPVLQNLPSAARNYISGPIAAELTPLRDSAIVLDIKRADEAFILRSSPEIQLSTDGIDISVNGNVTATTSAARALRTIDGTDLRARVSEFRLPSGSATVALAVPKLSFADSRLTGDFQIEGAYNGEIVDALAPARATASVRGAADLADTTLSLTIDANSAVMLDPLVLPDRVNTETAPRLTLATPFRIKLDTATGLASLTYKGSASLSDNRLNIIRTDGVTSVALSETLFDIEGLGLQPRLEATIAQITAPEQKVSASGLTLAIALSDTPTLDLAIAEIRQTAETPLVVPVQLTASAKQEGDRVSFESRLFDTPEQISIALSGEHDLRTKTGSASVDAQKITFIPSVLQPTQIFPILGRTLREVDGEIDALAKLAWADGQFDSNMELLVTATALKADEFSLENASAIIQFDSLAPLSTPPNQEINIGSLDIGIPLLNGRAEFQLAKDGRIHGSLRELDFFGGRIETEEFTIPENFDGFTVPLLVNGASLEDMLALLQQKDLEATGALNGRIPIVIEGGEVAVRNGILETAEGGGKIQYQPAEEVRSSLAGSNEGMALLLDIVDDFEYDTVQVTLNEDAFGDVAFKFQIRGRNQAVHNGIPVHLNVSMDGPLRKILNQGLKSYSLPERLLSRIQEFKDSP